MISEDPFKASSQRSFAFVISISTLTKVPYACSSGNDELSAANDERADPEQAEEMIDPHISSGLIPLDVGNNNCPTLFRLAHRVHIDC